MTERFELKVNQHDQYDIIDWEESEKNNAICIYNDLGCYHFSSAMVLCKLLNEFNDKCEFLEIENEALEDAAIRYAELCHKSLKENEQLKQDINKLGEENYKIKSILLKKVEELNDAYNKSAKAGMPTGGIIGELDSFEEVCKIMEWIK